MAYQYGAIAAFGPSNSFMNKAITGSAEDNIRGSLIVGSGNTLHSQYGAAFGADNTVSGSKYSYALGKDNETQNNFTFAVGDSNVVSGSNGAIAMGSGNTSAYTATVALGESNVVGDDVAFPPVGRAAMAIGRGNSVKGDYSAGFGYNHTISGASVGTTALGVLHVADETSYASTLMGYAGKSSRFAEVVHSAAAFSTTGDAQACHLISKNQTTDNSATELFTNGSSTRITIPTDTNATFSILIIGRQTNSAGEGGSYKVEGGIKNEGGTTALIGAGVTKTALAEDVAGWDVTVTADNTNNSLKIEVTGAVGDNVNWVAYTTLVQTTG